MQSNGVGKKRRNIEDLSIYFTPSVQEPCSIAHPITAETDAARKPPKSIRHLTNSEESSVQSHPSTRSEGDKRPSLSGLRPPHQINWSTTVEADQSGPLSTTAKQGTFPSTLSSSTSSLSTGNPKNTMMGSGYLETIDPQLLALVEKKADESMLESPKSDGIPVEDMTPRPPEKSTVVSDMLMDMPELTSQEPSLEDQLVKTNELMETILSSHI